ncbi:DUF4381 family protein [Lysobacter fragariae]
MQAPPLVLRDIHELPAPPLWPPAPGWWLLAATLIAIFVVAWYLRLRRLHRRRAIAAVFDDALGHAKDEPARIAAMSDLLRRAARRRDAGADKLHGDAWLRFLDAGNPAAGFSDGVGRLLLDGGFRSDADPRDVDALRTLARARFMQWMLPP